MPRNAYYVSSQQAVDIPALLGVLLEHVPLGISLVDRDLNVVLANRTMLELLDFPTALFENVFRVSTGSRWAAIGMSGLPTPCRMGSCPCKGFGGPIARFRPNPKGKWFFGALAALQSLVGQ